MFFVIGVKADNPFLYPIFLYFNYWLTYYFDPDDDLSGLSSSEGRIQRHTKKVNIVFGLVGAIIVGYKNVYAYFAGLFGGHRSWFSHKIPFSMIGRMVVYNFGLFYFLYAMFGYIVDYYDLVNADFQYEIYLDIWFLPYISTQFLAFMVQDILHLMLDSDWAEGILYTKKSSKRGTKTNGVATQRNSQSRRNKEWKSNSSNRRKSFRSVLCHKLKKVDDGCSKTRTIPKRIKHNYS